MSENEKTLKEKAFIKLEGVGVDIEIGKFDVKIEGKSLNELLKNAVGLPENADYSDFIRFRGNLSIVMREEGQELSSVSNIKYKKKEMKTMGKVRVIEITGDLGVTIDVGGSYVKPNAGMKLLINDVTTKEEREQIYKQLFDELLVVIDKQLEGAMKK